MSGALTVTNLHSGQRWHSQTLERGPLDSVHQVSVYPDCRYQRFEGFGGAFTEAAAYSWEQLPEGRRKAFLDCYFGPEGLGYSRGRVHIGSCDFALGNYACQSGPGDEGFDTSRDDQRLIPMILAAQAAAGKPIGLLLSPWSPPGFMKTNGEMNHGGAPRPLGGVYGPVRGPLPGGGDAGRPQGGGGGIRVCCALVYRGPFRRTGGGALAVAEPGAVVHGRVCGVQPL